MEKEMVENTVLLDESYECRLEEVKKKLGRHELKAKEVAKLWGYLKYGPSDTINEKTIRKHIKTLCRISKTLQETDFLKDGVYIIAPNIQNLFFCLLDSGFLSENHKNTVQYRKKLNQNLLESIKRWLDEDDMEILQKNGAFLNAKLENEVIWEYFAEWFSFNRTLFESNVYIKYQIMQTVIKYLRQIHRSINANIKSAEIRLAKEKECVPGIETDFYLGNKLESVLVSMMAKKVLETPDRGENEIEAFYKMCLNFTDRDIRNKRETKERMSFSDHQRYMELIEKINNIFNLKDEWEKQVSNIVLQLMEALYMIQGNKRIEYGNIFSDERVKKRENTYLNFFVNYKELSKDLKIIHSKEYKMYMKIKDDPKFQTFLSETMKQ